MNEWLDIIEYREFHDIPRIFLVKRNGKLYFFDCPFDDDLDEYRSEYSVYEMPEFWGELPEDWNSMPGQATKNVGSVKVESVTFDPSKRKRIDATELLDLIG